MDMADLMIAMLFGALLVMAGFWMAYVMLRPLMQRGTSMADLLRDAVHATDPRTEVPEDDEEEEEQAALPMDPDNPPFPRVYHRSPGRPVRQCHCHGRDLEDNEVVLFWPNPDVQGAFWLVCAPEDMKVPI